METAAMQQSAKMRCNSLPTTQCAIIQTTTSDLTHSSSTALPALLSPTEILVRVGATALNPTDYKMPRLQPTPGAIAGCDFAGTVVAVGAHATATATAAAPATATAELLQIGDRVCGAVHGSNPLDGSNGAFAQYVRAEAGLVLKLPREMPLEAAAAIGGIGWGTLGLALWGSLGLQGRPSRPVQKPIPVLVYGAATATGTMAVQLLRL